MPSKSPHIRRRAEYDAIVVGSGITGGWAAKELTEKGLDVLLIERGRKVEHGKDYLTEHKPPWDFRFRGMGDRALYAREYQIQSQCYAFDETTRHFFVNDAEHPYTYDDEMPFNWIRGYQLGGRSLTWARQCYRWSDLDFEANARDGFGVDWPIRYRDIAPWYDYVERFVGVSGQAEGFPQLPDGQFLPPMEMNCGERFVKEGIERHVPNVKMTIGRAAVLTQNHNGRAACHYCGPCYRGCSTGSYFSSLSATLPAAMATGKLTILCDKIVHSVMYDESNDRSTGVLVVDANSGETEEHLARLIFLCASTLGSTQIMLNSKTRRFPEGIANGSGALGHYLMDHPFEAGATADIPAHGDQYYYGNRPNGVYIPRFQNLDAATRNRDFLRGYGCQGESLRAGWDRGISERGLGAEFKQALRTPGPWNFWLGGWGEHLPRYDNHVTLDPEITDKWGIPVLRMHCTWSENERKMLEHMEVSLSEMLEAAGCTNVQPFNLKTPPGHCIHEMGTARMGRDPKSSVLNAHNQAHEVPNLFLTDGACMTSSACQNPSITYMALTARACHYAVDQLKKRNIS